MKLNKLFKTIIIICLASVGLTVSSLTHAEYAVIVHPSNNTELSAKQLQRIYLGKMKSYPTGGSIIPLDLAPGTVSRDTFNEEVLKKSEQQLTSYWGRLIFTGKGLPPKQVASNDEVKKLVAKNPSTIGYIEKSEVDASVKIVATF